MATNFRPTCRSLVEVLADEARIAGTGHRPGRRRAVPDPETPDLEAKLAGLQSPRGWGLFLIKNLVDEMRTRSDGVHHVIELIMQRQGDRMTTQPRSATVRHERTVAIIDLEGEINGLAEAALQTAYAEAISTQPRTILLNFSKVEYINSTGIALIVGILARARQSNRKLLACGLSEHYIEIFEITRLADFMGMFPDEQAALAGAPLSG